MADTSPSTRFEPATRSVYDCAKMLDEKRLSANGARLSREPHKHP